MPQVSLADIRAAAERKYGNLTVALPDGATITLRSPLRLSKEERELLGDVEQLAGTGDPEAVTEALRIAAANPHHARLLLAALGDDLAAAAELFEQWATSVSPGEASPSAS